MADPTLDSNIDEIGSWLDQLVDTYNFTRPGTDQSLGRDLAGVVAQGIQDRTVADQTDANGGPLKPNEPKYAKWKAKRFDAHQPLVRGGQMLSLQSLIGEVEVTADEVIMHYGTGDEEPLVSSTGAVMPRTIHKQIGAVEPAPTDREKAEWNSDDRPFYALDDKIGEAVRDAAAAALGEHLADGA